MSTRKYDYDICVVGGAGHVGLPFALVYAEKGFKVAIYDISQAALDTIGKGIVPFMESGGDELLGKVLAGGNLALSGHAGIVAQARTIVVTIGTPVDEFLNPEFKGIRSSFESLLPFISDDQLLILRSTVYPGTTEWLARWLRSEEKEPLLSFCPERVVQGKAIEEIRSLPQIVSGTSQAAEDAAAGFFEQIGVEIVRLSPMEAEFSKLFSNAYRYISFAIANQFYTITTSAGVDYQRVMEGVKYHYPRLEGLAGAGFAAGPCLFKDTMQLNAFAKNQFVLGQAAMNVNEGLILFIAEQLGLKYKLEDKTIGLLGMAFKPDNDDIRSSLSYKMKKVMQLKALQVLTTDPYVTIDPELVTLEDVIEGSDILILCVPHKQYKNLDTGGKPVVDIWNYLEKGSLV